MLKKKKKVSKWVKHGVSSEACYDSTKLYSSPLRSDAFS